MALKTLLRDQVPAELMGVGSALLNKLPHLGGIALDLDHVDRPPVRWRPARGTNVRQIFEQMLSFEGNRTSGRIPSRYREVALLSFAKDHIDEVAADNGGRHAAAYLYGTSVLMVGASDVAEIYGNDPEDRTRYIVGMKIGRGTLHTIPGLVLPDQSFIAAATSVSAERMSVDDVPFSVPVL